MWSQCILLSVLLAYALGLECYANNSTKPGSTNKLAKGFVLQNCMDIIRNSSRLQGLAHLDQPPDLEYTCYTLSISDNTAAVDVTVKGCTLVGTCNVLKEYVKYRTECVECTADKCNGKETFSGSHFSTIFFLIFVVILLISTMY